MDSWKMASFRLLIRKWNICQSLVPIIRNVVGETEDADETVWNNIIQG